MAFLRVEQKKLGKYLRIVQSFKQMGCPIIKRILIKILKLEVPKDCTAQGIINQYFT